MKNKKSKTQIKNQKYLDKNLIKSISKQKDEPKWMLKRRLRAFEVFEKMPMPKFGPDLSNLDFEKVIFYKKPEIKKAKTWQDVPQDIKKTFDKLGIPEQEQRFLAGLGTQVDSAMVYQSFKKHWEKKGIIFEDMDTAVQKYPDLIKEHFMTRCVLASNNKFAALHGALWSGGSFVFVPENVKLAEPIEGYFFLKSKQMGQFEHTLIIAEEGSQISYIEGCSAARYSQDCLHSGAVEIFVGKQARVSYLTIQNWSRNVLNFNTKRAFVEEKGIIEWVSGSFGSRMTMLYPTSILQGKGAKSTHLSVTVAGRGQDLDTGGKVIHQAPETTSNIVAKSIVKDNGKASYRGMVKVEKGAKGAKTSINCENLILGKKAIANTYPALQIEEKEAEGYHEAKTGKIAEDQLFYLMSRGLSEKQATALIINGFLEPVIDKFPLEYSVELSRLIELER